MKHKLLAIAILLATFIAGNLSAAIIPRAIGSLPGKIDTNGALMVRLQAAATAARTGAIGKLTGKVDTNDALVVAASQVSYKVYTVATLPSSPAQGDIAYVSDSTTVTFNATVTGMGSNGVAVQYNGTNWKVF